MSAVARITGDADHPCAASPPGRGGASCKRPLVPANTGIGKAAEQRRLRRGVDRPDAGAGPRGRALAGLAVIGNPKHCPPRNWIERLVLNSNDPATAIEAERHTVL